MVVVVVVVVVVRVVAVVRLVAVVRWRWLGEGSIASDCLSRLCKAGEKL